MRWLWLIAAAAVVLSGCGKPAFTMAVRERYNLAPVDMRRLQFYTSGEIVLRRELPTVQRGTSGNTLLMSDGVVVEEIVIPMKTPGVALRVEGDFLLISFSREHPDRALWFTTKKEGEEVIPLDDKQYTLVHLENGAAEPPPFEPRYSKGYLLSYGGYSYQLADGKMWGVHLLYDEGSFAQKRVVREPPGWKLSDGVPPAPAPSP